MKNKYPKDFEVHIDPEEPVFVIGIVSELVGMPIWTLRRLDEEGIVTPRRIRKKIRCYSRKQIAKLKYIAYLMEKKHVNIQGIKMILEITSEKSGIVKNEKPSQKRE